MCVCVVITIVVLIRRLKSQVGASIAFQYTYMHSLFLCKPSSKITDGIDSSATLRHNTRKNEESLSGSTAVGPARRHLVRYILEGRQRGIRNIYIYMYISSREDSRSTALDVIV